MIIKVAKNVQINPTAAVQRIAQYKYIKKKEQTAEVCITISNSNKKI